MHNVEPSVYLIAESRVNQDQLQAMLRNLGGDTATDWLTKTQRDSKSDGELVTEVAGRACYKSFGVGLNPNVTRIRDNTRDYLGNTLEKGDGSIFEHATCTFAFLNVSRVFTHELVRHRAGVAISQESMRYARPTNIGINIPGVLDDVSGKFIKVVEDIEKGYRELEGAFDWETMSMPKKKELTSALRRILPDGIATNIIWTANHRTIRWVIEMRTDPAAETEIRTVFNKVAEIMVKKYPNIYQDFWTEQGPNNIPRWVPKYSKV